MSLIGVVYGTVLVNLGKTGFSETFPELWLFLMGGLFIAVVMFFPNGLAGIWNKYAPRFKFLRRLNLIPDPKTLEAEIAPAVSVKEIVPDVGTPSEQSSQGSKS